MSAGKETPYHNSKAEMVWASVVASCSPVLNDQVPKQGLYRNQPWARARAGYPELEV